MAEHETVPDGYVAVADAETLREEGRTVTAAEGTPVAVFFHEGEFRAVNNRCPHMGFPLSEGSVEEGVLTCHWHHARFELSYGDTFDPWADDVESYPLEVVDGTVYIDPNPPREEPPAAHWAQRLEDGLEQSLRLVLAKAAVGLFDAGVSPVEPFETAVVFGTKYREGGWSSGLTILTALLNRMDDLTKQDRQRALYQGLVQVASDCADQPPKFDQAAFEATNVPVERLESWFRENVEVRDADGAERVLRTAVASDCTPEQLTEMLTAAATDHRYLDTGHRFDHLNKATEALDHMGWDHPETADVLASLVRGLASAERSEELSSWRQPYDLAARSADSFDRLSEMVAAGEEKEWIEPEDFTDRLHSDDPEAMYETLDEAVRSGATVEELARAVAFGAGKRVAKFSVANEFSDWNTVHHTFTFANAVHRAAQRAPSTELYRGVYDAATNVYLDRFLNMPPAPEPAIDETAALDEEIQGLRHCFEMEGELNAAGAHAANFLDAGGDPARLKAELSNALLQEDTGFHTFQALEAGLRQFDLREDPAERRVLATAVARYLAAHYPTRREREQTFSIASRLHRGERIHEGSDEAAADD
ncbi:Rieske (2Fe-2S) iron-sulfur domain-containing protein [halophilic archaeon DL31]|jgi:nitrite reductase/ring-hydroxylating ferredoxin subunit|nr:Rieske (2Fe-2S) iron-sulfur domain-containing protein [halophilic archaeon DL31]